MPVDPCLPVPLGGVPPHGTGHVHRVHRIIGRIRRHGTARHVGVKRAVAPLDGCGRVPPGIAGSIPDGRPAVLPKVIPAVATGGALIGGGSGVIGGFGPPGGSSGGITPPNTGGGGHHTCVGVSCTPGGPGTSVPEPASFLILAVGLACFTLARAGRARI